VFVLMTDALTRANASISVSRLAFGGCLQTLALCTVSNFADTLRRFAVYPRFALCRAALLNPTTKNTHLTGVCFCCVNTSSYYVCSLFVQLHSIHSEFTFPGSPFEDALTLIFILLYDLKFSICKEEYPICVISENSPSSNEI